MTAPDKVYIRADIAQAQIDQAKADARAEALREAASRAWAQEDGDRWTRASIQSAILAMIGDTND